jgi:hypothetical protein
MAMLETPNLPTENGWGVLHEWLEHGEVKGYVYGPLPTIAHAEAALAAVGCDCATKIIGLVFPIGVTLSIPTEHVPASAPGGTPLLPDRKH